MAELFARVLDFLSTRTRAARLRLQLSHHADLLGKLPEDLPARARLGQHINDLTDRLVDLEARQLSRKRDVGKIVTGIVMTLLFALAAAVAVEAGGWWLLTLILTVPIALAGVSGVVSDARGQIPEEDPKVDD